MFNLAHIAIYFALRSRAAGEEHIAKRFGARERGVVTPVRSANLVSVVVSVGVRRLCRNVRPRAT